jgi:hypothetical protein
LISTNSKSIKLINNNFNFKRASTAYRLDGKLVGVDTPRHDIGYFGNGLLTEEGTTNLVPQDNNWIVNSGLTFTGMPNKFAVVNPNPTATDNTGSGAFYRSFAKSTTVGDVYTASFEVESPVDFVFPVKIDADNGSSAVISNVTVLNIKAGKARYSCSLSVTTATTGNIRIVFYPPNGTTNVGNIQLEQKAFATSFINGTRAQDFANVPTSNLSVTQGTIECWVYFGDTFYNAGSNWRRIFSIGNSNAVGRFALYGNGTNINFTMNSYTIPTATPTRGWHFIAVRWSATDIALFVDGVKKSSYANPTLESGFGESIVTLGGRSDLGDCINTVIDDVRFSSVARTDAELGVLPTAPLVADANTTLKLDFNNPFSMYDNGNLAL